MKKLTYGDLPKNPLPGVILYCPECGSECSANRRDYFYNKDNEPIGACCLPEVPFQLVQKRVVFKRWRKP